MLSPTVKRDSGSLFSGLRRSSQSTKIAILCERDHKIHEKNQKKRPRRLPRDSPEAPRRPPGSPETPRDSPEAPPEAPQRPPRGGLGRIVVDLDEKSHGFGFFLCQNISGLDRTIIIREPAEVLKQNKSQTMTFFI